MAAGEWPKRVTKQKPVAFANAMARGLGKGACRLPFVTAVCGSLVRAGDGAGAGQFFMGPSVARPGRHLVVGHGPHKLTETY